MTVEPDTPPTRRTAFAAVTPPKIFEQTPPRIASRSMVQHALFDTSMDRPNQNVIIFDWDDTLFPSLADANEDLSPYSWSQFDILLHAVLEAALRHAPQSTFVVTNSFCERVDALLSTKLPVSNDLMCRVRVLSARKEYCEAHGLAAEQFSFEHCLAAKAWLFSSLARGLYSSAGVNILSVGDMPTDLQATQALLKGLSGSTAKFIKFQEMPTFREVVLQLGRLREVLACDHQRFPRALDCKAQLGEVTELCLEDAVCAREPNSGACGCQHRCAEVGKNRVEEHACTRAAMDEVSYEGGMREDGPRCLYYDSSIPKRQRVTCAF